MIRAVHTLGFKGDHADYRLERLNVIKGPHGSGKSRCREAIQYALSGKIPGTGKRNDDLSKFFSDRGGFVHVALEDGSWLERGLKVDHEKALVSEFVKSSEETPDGKPDLSAFQASNVVLNLGELIGEGATLKSPEKKREWILKLLGGGPSSANVFEEIEKAYAKELNPMARPEHLLDPRDLPGDVRQYAREWTRERGVAEVLESCLKVASKLPQSCLKVQDASLTETLSVLLRIAGEQKRDSAAAAREARAAIRELEAEMESAEVEAGTLPARDRAVKDAVDRLEKASTLWDRYRIEKARLGKLEQKYKEAAERLGKAELELQAVVDPGPEPEKPVIGDDLRAAEQGLEALQERERALRLELEKIGELCAQQTYAEHLAERVQKLLHHHREKPWAEVVEILDRLSGQADIPKEYFRLVEILQDLSARHREDDRRLETELVEAREKNEVFKARIQECTPAPSIAANLRRAEESVQIQADRVRQLRLGEQEVWHYYDQERKAWEAASRRKETLGRIAEEARRERSRYAKEHDETELDANTLMCELQNVCQRQTFPVGIEPERDALGKARESFKSAQEAAGKVKAYQTAKDRAAGGKTAEEAWKIAERAIKGVRESLVTDAAGPLLESANQVLEAAGREERLYLRLENQRGKPDWELGWITGGERRPLDALSGAETLLASVALSTAIAVRSPGRRVLLVEAAEIHGDLPALLAALSVVPSEIENVVVLTALPEIRTPPGWQVIELDGAKEVVPMK